MDIFKKLVYFDLQLFIALNTLAGRSKAGDFFITLLAEYLPYALIALTVVSLFTVPVLMLAPMLVIVSTLVGSLVSRYLFGTPLRFIYRRSRPFKVHRVHNVLTEESFSFPSGHSLFFFGYGAVLFCWNHPLGIFFLVSSCIVTLFRVIAGVHYPADILAGMIIGLISGFGTFYLLTPFLNTLVNHFA